MTKAEILTLGIVGGFIVSFPLFWCFVIWVISRVGGWASLAASYAARSEPQGARWSWRSLRINPFANYSGCLKVTLAPEGIYMVPMWMFRFGREPLLLPWECVESVKEQRFFVRCWVVSMSAKGKSLMLMLPGAAEEALRKYPRKQLPIG